MKFKITALMFVATVLLAAVPAFADEYDDTIAIFKGAGESAKFFENSYGYAVFPTVGKAVWASVQLTAQGTSTSKASTSAS